MDIVKLGVVFFRSSNGREPVRDWLRGLEKAAKKITGEDIKTVQYGWPLGMPRVRSLGGGLWEIRCNLPSGIARIVFVVRGDLMVLLHGFIKKSRKTPKKELAVARKRAAALAQGDR